MVVVRRWWACSGGRGRSGRDSAAAADDASGVVEVRVFGRHVEVMARTAGDFGGFGFGHQGAGREGAGFLVVVGVGA